jgi:hypothetical protein
MPWHVSWPPAAAPASPTPCARPSAPSWIAPPPWPPARKQQPGIDISLYRDLAHFTDIAVQIRYDDQPDLRNLDRCSCNNCAVALVTLVETLLPPPASP